MSLKELKEQKEVLVGKLDEIKLSVGDGVMSDDQLVQWDEYHGELADLNSKIETQERFLSVEKAKPTPERKFSAGPTFISKQFKADDEINAFRAWALTNIKREDAIPTQWSEAANRMGVRVNAPAFHIKWDQSVASQSNVIPGATIGGVLKRLKDMGGIMSVASVINTANGNDVRFLYRDTTAFAAGIVSELGSTTNTTQSETAVVLGSYSWRSGIFKLSYELLTDSGYDVLSDYQEALVDSFRLGFGAAFATGDGSTEPNGIETAIATPTVTPALNGTDYDDLVTLYHSVDVAYRQSPSCVWVMCDAQVADLKKLVDGNGRPLWNSSVNSNIVVGQEGSLLGKPVVVDNNVTDGKIFFGDFSKYKIRLVGDVRTQMLNELYALNAAVGIVGFARMDADLLDAHAIKSLDEADV